MPIRGFEITSLKAAETADWANSRLRRTPHWREPRSNSKRVTDSANDRWNSDQSEEHAQRREAKRLATRTHLKSSGLPIGAEVRHLI